MAIKLKVVDSGDALRKRRQEIIAKIILSKSKTEESKLQRQLSTINKRIRKR